jgi:hypothetical protein
VLGVWDRWNATTETEPYGMSDTYRLGAEWLLPCSLVEDWGCGRGFLRNFIPRARYRGLDGSPPWADYIVDLTTYRSTVPGIFIRHVLEHNREWEAILANAVASFTQRMALILFTPVSSSTVEIAWSDDLGVPDIAFAPGDIEAAFDGLGWTKETMTSPTQYGVETIYRVIRGNREEL